MQRLPNCCWVSIRSPVSWIIRLGVLEFGISANAVAASLGLEPRQRDPESLVLPLHHEATKTGLSRTGTENNDRSVFRNSSTHSGLASREIDGNSYCAMTLLP